MTGHGILLDDLLLNPSSKIISCHDGHLSIRWDNLNKIINHSRNGSPSQDDIPIILLSIVGSPSNEKTVLCSSFMRFYEKVMSSQGQINGTVSKYTDKLALDTNDLSESGVYLLHKPYYLPVLLEEGRKGQVLLWMLYLYQGVRGTDHDRQLLEIFLMLISSRVAEVTLETEHIRMLRRWSTLLNMTSKICHSFLHVFPKVRVHPPGSDIRLFTHGEGKSIISAKINAVTYEANAFNIGSVSEMNVIEVKRIHSIDDATTLQLFLNCIREFHQKSSHYFKFDSLGRMVQLGGFQQFIESNVGIVNGMAAEASAAFATRNQSRQNVTGAISSSNDLSRRGQVPYGFQPDNYGYGWVDNEGVVPMNGSNLSRLFAGCGGGAAGTKEAQLPVHPALPDQFLHSIAVLTTQPRRTTSQLNNIYPNYAHQNALENSVCPTNNRRNEPTTIQVGQANELGTEFQERDPSKNSNRSQNQTKKPLPQSETEEEINLSMKLIPDMVFFYNEEMKRFLAEDIYDSEVLNKIHEKLTTTLSSNFKNCFNVNDEHTRLFIEGKLRSSLNECYPRHRQRNSENWKMKQAKISKCLQKMMSLYMEEIENVLLQNPQGMAIQDLKGKQDIIVNLIRTKMGVEIQGKIREDEPLEGHLNSLQAEVDEYYECIQERNNENLKRSKSQADGGRSIPHKANNSESSQQKGISSGRAKIQPEVVQPSTSSSQTIRQEGATQTTSYQNQSDNEIVIAKLTLQDIKKRLRHLLDKNYISNSNDREPIYKRLYQVSALINNRHATLEEVREEIRVLNWIYNRYYTEL